MSISKCWAASVEVQRPESEGQGRLCVWESNSHHHNHGKRLYGLSRISIGCEVVVRLHVLLSATH